MSLWFHKVFYYCSEYMADRATKRQRGIEVKPFLALLNSEV